MNAPSAASALLLAGVVLKPLGAARQFRGSPRWWSEIGHLWPTRAWESGAPDWSRALVWTAAQASGVPSALIAAVAHVESRWRAQAISSAGAIGIMQLMPQTAGELGVDPRDPTANILGGALYLRAQLDRFDALDLALAAYNAGPERVARTARIPNVPETLRYVEAVRRRLGLVRG